MRTCEALLIQLDPPDAPQNIHTNGDKLRGQVTFLSGFALNIDRISIHLKGKAKSRVVTGSGDNRRVHHADSIFFDYKRDLPLTTIPTSTFCSWPFEFEFPWETQPTHQPGPFGPHESFEHEPGTPLPPSFNDYSMKNDQMIYYYLEVVANDCRARLFHEKKNRLFIAFAPSSLLPTPPSPNPYSKTTALSRCTKKLDPELVAREEALTFSERTRRIFSASEPKPVSHFVISSTVPYQGCAGGRFPISMGITHQTTHSCAPPQIPVVTLNNINARLTAHTRARVPYRTFTDPGLRHNHYKHSTHKIYFFNRSCSIPMFENMNLEDLLSNLILPESLLPNFRTYNISRQYELKVTATLFCVGESYEIALSRNTGISAFNVVPNLCSVRFREEEINRNSNEQRRIAEGVRATERSLPADDDDVEWLPPYEQIETKPPAIE